MNAPDIYPVIPGPEQKVSEAEKLVSTLQEAYIGDENIPRMVAAIALIGADRAKEFRPGSVMFDGYPGTGKSKLSKALAAAIGGKSAIVQCTPDLMPGDLTGIAYMNHGELKLAPSPFISSNVVLLDEISRSSPKTQAAALGAMQDGYITHTGITMEAAGEIQPTPDPFIVLATQNSNEIDTGTYPLNLANKDRFTGNVFLPRPSLMNILTAINRNDGAITKVSGSLESGNHPTVSYIASPSSVVSLDQFRSMQVRASEVTLGNQGEKIALFAHELGRMSTGVNAPFVLPSGFRMPIDFARLAKAYAYTRGESGVASEILGTVAPVVATHRMDLGFNAGDSLEETYALKVGYINEALVKAGIKS